MRPKSLQRDTGRYVQRLNDNRADRSKVRSAAHADPKLSNLHSISGKPLRYPVPIDKQEHSPCRRRA